MRNYYIDNEGLPHFPTESEKTALWRKVIDFSLDECHAAGMGAQDAANFLLNGAAYLLGTCLADQTQHRQIVTNQMVAVFRAKVEQAAEEERNREK